MSHQYFRDSLRNNNKGNCTIEIRAFIQTEKVEFNKCWFMIITLRYHRSGFLWSRGKLVKTLYLSQDVVPQSRYCSSVKMLFFSQDKMCEPGIKSLTMKLVIYVSIISYIYAFIK